MTALEKVAQEAATWAANLYEERTRTLGAGGVDILSAHPAYRVSWHEVIRQFPALKGPDGRTAFQEPFNKAIKKRLLWRVMHSKQSSEDWVKKNPPKVKI